MLATFVYYLLLLGEEGGGVGERNARRWNIVTSCVCVCACACVCV